MILFFVRDTDAPSFCQTRTFIRLFSRLARADVTGCLTVWLTVKCLLRQRWMHFSPWAELLPQPVSAGDSEVWRVMKDNCQRKYSRDSFIFMRSIRCCHSTTVTEWTVKTSSCVNEMLDSWMKSKALSVIVFNVLLCYKYYCWVALYHLLC